MENPYLRSAFAFLTTEAEHLENILVSSFFKFSVYIVSFTCKHATTFSVIDYKICTLTHK